MWWYADRAVARARRRARAAARRGPGAALDGRAARARRPASPKPRLYLMRDGLPRACSAGRGPRNAAIAVSRGLLQALPPAELEGVLAHELAHIRHRDVFVQSVAVATAAAIVEASRIGGWFRRWLLFVLGPVAAAFVHLLLSPKREFDADRAGALLCGSPHGLAAALMRLDQASELVQFEGEPGRRAALHDQSVRAGRARRPLLHASAGRGAREAPAGARPRRAAYSRHERRAALAALSKLIRRRPTLPGGCPPSTIGAGGLNFSVRNGKRCTPAAMTAEIVKRAPVGAPSKLHSRQLTCSKSRPRAISTGALNASPRLHVPPINVVVSHGPYSLEGMGSLISRWASRLDAFSGYPIQT